MNIYFGTAQFSWLEPAVSLIAVLLGAVLAWSTSYYFEHRRIRSETEARAYSIFYKLAMLLDDIAKLRSVVQSARIRLDELDSDEGIWRVLFDSSGFADVREGFTAAEYAILSQKEGLKIVTDLMQVENSHRIAMASYREILKLKREFHDFGLSRNASDRKVSYTIEGEDYYKIAPIIINLSDLSKNLDNQIDGFLSHGMDTSLHFCTFAKSALKFKRFPIPKFDESLTSLNVASGADA